MPEMTGRKRPARRASLPPPPEGARHEPLPARVPDGHREERPRHQGTREGDDEGRHEYGGGRGEIHIHFITQQEEMLARGPLPTVDIIIEVGEKIVLIRRKHPPP